MSNGCIVCDRPLPFGANKFCCPGCSAVFSIIEKLNLEGSEKDERISQLLEGVFPGGEDIDSNNNEPDNGDSLSLLIEGMVCPACAWLIHNRLSKIDGVGCINVNFIAETCDLKFNPMKISQDEIDNIIYSLGYKSSDFGKATSCFDYLKFGTGWFLALNTMMISFVVYSAEVWSVPLTMQWICSILLVIFGTWVPFYSARSTIQSGITQIKSGMLRMESLVFISTMAAWIYSMISVFQGTFERLYFDVVALLLMLIETGNLITGSFYRKLHQRITSMSLQLPKKVRISDDNYCDVNHLEPGQPFEVLRDELVPVDGIISTSAEFDFSLITGESVGVWMEVGSLIGSGSKLLSERATFMIPPSGKSNLLEKMVESTIDAFNTKHENITLGDKISQIFVPIVTILGIIVFIICSFFYNINEGFSRLLSVLIVACPCAFGIAEPLVLTSALDQIRRLGIQFFNGSVLALKPSIAIFDKTGTLTKGTPEVDSVYWLVKENQKWLDILASLENGVQHPIARSCVTLGSPFSVNNRTINRTEVTAEIDGVIYRAGSSTSYPDVNIPEHMNKSTLVFFGDENECYFIISLNDPLRTESGDLINSFRKLSIKPFIFSGDRQEVVDVLSSKLDVEYAYGSMSSLEKKHGIEKLQSKGETVLMVGDGINDTQALAAADIGIAVYSGQIPAKMSSDGVLLQPGIRMVNDLPLLQKKVRKKIRLNYGWAFLYNSVGVFLASMGWLSPKYCAVGMVFSNLVVIYNSIFGMKLKKN